MHVAQRVSWLGRLKRRARVREEASMESGIVGELDAGALIECLGVGACPISKVERVQIRGGWVSAKLVAVSEDGVEHVRTQKPVRLWVLSDVHTDRPSNFGWLEKHLVACGDEQYFDVLVCAGDVASRADVFRKTMALFTSRFDAVVLTAGNHDLWTTGSSKVATSLEKLDEVRATCGALGVRLGPFRINDVLVAPLYSWYDRAFDAEPDIDAGDTPERRKRWIDYTYCKWGPSLETLEGFHFSSDRGASKHVAHHFATMNGRRLREMEKHLFENKNLVVITVSHFAPRPELLPEKRFLIDPHLPKVSGSKIIETQLRRLRPAAHVFGHTHLAVDSSLDAVRYVNWPLGSDRERTNQTRVVAGSGALLLYASDAGFTPVQWTFWSEWYRRVPRDPTNLTLAPWVENAYKLLGLDLPRGCVTTTNSDEGLAYPGFPDNMRADDFYRLNAATNTCYRSTRHGDDLQPNSALATTTT
ncbi:hypothetical protein CTAYLR_000453 [Chrysophaeum taylorii]|uniref:Calcineurin-like phosphoesterase domain-containing protein n=1 Tax=Chrysophaeum taylorii TaxID=2483200 RepID=A0AAD7XQF2_9STRA|nr:hypothetical protein CTAYLR_000453 [Chrysophaeum taylorii]